MAIVVVFPGCGDTVPEVVEGLQEGNGSVGGSKIKGLAERNSNGVKEECHSEGESSLDWVTRDACWSASPEVHRYLVPRS